MQSTKLLFKQAAPFFSNKKIVQMDAADGNIPKIMWHPDRSQTTKMDVLRKIINEKYGTQLGKATGRILSSASHSAVTCDLQTCVHGRVEFVYVRMCVYERE